ncbi:hypothetical protein GLOIN_2v1883277 [Rhizophagus irregularis DAOM 181602=DAOM 197198]|uniref:Uncharacterized protein n=1 Tax=Rhizophagus irregularis (strain DAOM 197198w) TaxID=1432141 RepID=A0A015J0K8_RHIIW|nr:hypothetical protein RirG_181980 [Rhizophagus irregularis DAOM 197198w]GET54322.1 hypothetical protein GLOIN_2v1883277 [Rhizophagus irregularis DAOM 181602=DAOM 197198]
MSLVELPLSTATSSREQELLDRIASLEASLNKSVYEFDVIVRPKQNANKWTLNIERSSIWSWSERLPKRSLRGSIFTFQSLKSVRGHITFDETE